MNSSVASAGIARKTEARSQAQPLISIQYLRGVAACMVAVFHTFIQLNKFQIPTPSVVHVLSSGVDIFFVISGFVMWYTTANTGTGTTEFYRNRIIRIVPLYWAITTLMLVVMLVRPAMLQSSSFNLTHIIASYLFFPFPHPVRHVMEPLLFPGWTLNYEMFFYAIFGALLFFARRIIRITLLCLTFGVVVSVHPFAGSGPISFYTEPIILEFSAGSLLGFVFLQQRYQVSASAAAAICVAGAVALAASFWTGTYFPNVISRGIPALLIVAGAVYYERAKVVRTYLVPKMLGDSSYSIYLAHPLAQSAVTQVFSHFIRMPSLLACVLLIVLETLASVLAGLVSYRYVETPMLLVLRTNKRHTKISGRMSRAA